MNARTHIPVVLVLLATATVVAAFARVGDYSVAGHAAGNAGPGIHALLGGHVRGFFSVQPMMGLFSILLRLPFAGLADALGGDTRAIYAAGCFGCLLGPVALGTALHHRMLRQGRPAGGAWLLAILCVANPATLAGVRIGHPEEALAAALVVLAVLLARQRPLAAALLTGLAIGTKQWALVAVPPVVLAAGRRPLAQVVVAALVAACFLAPGPVGDRGAADAASRQVLDTGHVNVLTLWWPAAHEVRTSPGGTVTAHVLPAGLTRAHVAVLVAALALAMTLALWLRQRGGTPVERVLALLALILLVRCALDPGNLDYYAVAPLLALCAWEGLARTGPPVVAPAAMLCFWLLFGPVTGLDDTRIAIAFFGINAAFAVYLGLAAFAPRRLTGLRGAGQSDPAAPGTSPV